MQCAVTQLLAGLDPEAGDAEEIAAHDAPDLVISRSEVWAHQCFQMVMGATKTVDAARSKVGCVGANDVAVHYFRVCMAL